MVATQRLIARLLAPLRRRVLLMVGRAILTVIDDSTKSQTVQISALADEVRDAVERFQEYGYTSVPQAGAEALAVFVGGNRAHGVVVATEDRRYRPRNLSPGDVALYHRAGVRVFLDDDADLLHLGAQDAADFIAKAQLTLDRLSAIVTAFNSHVHPTGVGPSGVPSAAMSTPASVATTKVKAT